MKHLYFGQYWQVYGTNSIKIPDDFTLEQAIAYVKEHWSEVGLASVAHYVPDSDKPDFENCDFGDEDHLLVSS